MMLDHDNDDGDDDEENNKELDQAVWSSLIVIRLIIFSSCH